MKRSVSSSISWRPTPVPIASGSTKSVVPVGYIIALIGSESAALPDVAAENERLLAAIDRAALVFFTMELTLRLWAHRFAFFRGGWNLFDFAIVAIAWVPASGPLAVLRALRIVRVLRLISIVPQMRAVVPPWDQHDLSMHIDPKLGQAVDADEIQRLFDEKIVARAIELETGAYTQVAEPIPAASCPWAVGYGPDGLDLAALHHGACLTLEYNEHRVPVGVIGDGALGQAEYVLAGRQ